MASLLLLDVSGAFDIVNHERLLWVLKEKGFPTWVTTFLKSLLSDRTTTLLFDA